MTKKYDYLLFDLDDTFWSVKANQRCALGDIFHTFAMERYFEDFELFFDSFIAINTQLWIDYRDNKIDRFGLRNDRFTKVLSSVEVSDTQLALHMSDEYLRVTPNHTQLIDGSVEILDYLLAKGYPMSLVTNGFNEVQFLKVENSGLEKYFQHIITSEFAGCNKPATGIFDFALHRVGSPERDRVLMIGDDPHNDVFGAQQSGLDCVFFNEHSQEHRKEHSKEHTLKPTYEINHLLELKRIL